MVFDDNDDYYYYNNYLFIYIVTFQDTLSSSQLINFVLLKKKQDNYRSDWIARSFQIAFFCSYKWTRWIIGQIRIKPWTSHHPLLDRHEDYAVDLHRRTDKSYEMKEEEEEEANEHEDCYVTSIDTML